MIEIAVYAVVGALAGLIGWAVSRGVPSERRQLVGVAVTVILMTAGSPLVHRYLVDPYRLDAVLDATPAYRALEEHEPQAYQRIRGEMLEATRRGESAVAASARMRAAIGALLPKYLQRADDDALIDYMRVTMDELEQISRHDIAAAYAFLVPDPAKPVNVMAHISADLMRRDSEALARLIATGAKRREPHPPNARGEAAFEKVVEQVRGQIGDDFDALQRMGQPDADPQKIVRGTLVLYRTVFALPAADAAEVLRFLLR
jgi:hypothetical protein